MIRTVSSGVILVFALIVGCSDGPSPQGDYQSLVVQNAYLTIKSVNGKPASGLTFQTGDSLVYEGGFEVADDRTIEQLIVFCKLIRPVDDTQMLLREAESISQAGRFVTFSGTIQAPKRAGKYQLYYYEAGGARDDTELGSTTLTFR